MGHGASHKSGHGGSHHVVPFKMYLNVLLLLLGLTAVTVMVAKPVSGFDAGILNTFIAMGIASVKAGFVAAIFMHLKWDTKLHVAILVISVFFLVVMFSFCYFDIISRAHILSTL